MKAKSTFLVRKALASPTLVHGSPRSEGPVLPMPVHSGNLSLNKLVIRWMSDNLPVRLVEKMRQANAAHPKIIEGTSVRIAPATDGWQCWAIFRSIEPLIARAQL